jgi:hypothetical protein
MFWGTLAFGDFAETASDDTLRTLSVLDYYAVSGQTLAFAVFVGASSIVIARTGVLGRWLAYLGGIEVVLSLVAPLYVLSADTDSVFDVLLLIAFLGHPARASAGCRDAAAPRRRARAPGRPGAAP